MSTGTIKKVAGPLVIAQGMRDANMFDVVRVSDQRLIGEIIEIHGDLASVQVYEETSGLGPGAPVESTGAPLSVELGPCHKIMVPNGVEGEITAITGGSYTIDEPVATVALKNGGTRQLTLMQKWVWAPARR